VEKAIFSISCTTCQTRLAVRSPSAIGQILECPKCHSMVHVAPPPGWTPSAPTPPATADASTPPPLTKVAASPKTLDLEPAETSPSRAGSGRLWLLGAVGLLIVGAIVWALLTFAMPPAESEPAAVASTEQPAAAPARPAQQTKSPSTATAAPTTPAPSGQKVAKLSPPGPQSGGVKTPATTPSTPTSTPSTPPATPPSTPSSPPARTLPTPPEPHLGPAPPAAKEEQKKPAQEAAEGIENKQEVSKQPEIKKTPPPQVDIAARLADPLRGLELTDVPLARAIESLACVGALPVTFDTDALTRLAVAPRDRIALKLGPTTVGAALQAIAARRGLAVVTEGGQVLVTSPTEYRETLKNVRYDVSDLAGRQKSAAVEFAALVRRLVAPDSWQGDAGGRGTIEPEPGTLAVVQTGDVHQQVAAFCQRLRSARRLPLPNCEHPERFALTTRLELARKLLDRPVTVNFHDPTALAKILAYLAAMTESDILVDHAALAAADTSDRVETSLTVERQPLASALAGLLAPLGLTYRVVGADTLQVTTKEAADERLELEFYPVGARPDGDRAGEKLIERLRTQASPTSWSGAGGWGEAHFDATAGYLIVLQSQPVQQAIARLLQGDTRKGEGGRGKGE
jgi:hypothetical protein